MPGRVHISSETYALLKAAGKDKWVTARDADVFVKGKGNLTTYWLNGKGTFPGSQVSSTDKNSSVVDDIYQLTSDKTSRLIAWNVDLLQNILKQIVARRNVCTGKRKPTPVFVNEKIIRLEAGKTFIDEVCEIIELPEFEKGISRRQEDPESIELPKKVAMQLTEYVTCIVRLYKSNVSENIF